MTWPDGKTETILAVPNYDFDWQTEYVFRDAAPRAEGLGPEGGRDLRQLDEQQVEP